MDAETPLKRLDHYFMTTREEHSRLSSTFKGQLEYLRMQELVTKHLPRGVKCSVADVGGGTGAHARWLEAQGHRVVMCDLNEKHVAMAAASGVDAVVADAMDLPWPGGAHHAALVAGPLYHLKKKAERVRALGEAARVCMPGSPVMVAALNRWAPLLGRATAGVVAGHEGELIQISLGGQATGAEGWPGIAYYHSLEGLVGEMEEAGLEGVVVYGLNGPAAWLGVAADRFFPAGKGVPGAEFLEDALRAARVADRVPGAQVLSSLFFAVGLTPCGGW